MNIICKYFGHKFVGHVSHMTENKIFTRALEEPICKRCGISVNLINKKAQQAEKVNK